MISVVEAKKLISEQISRLKPIPIRLEHAAGHVLAEDVFAKFDIPAFRQSSMDGYAIRFEDRLKPLERSGEMAAGAAHPLQLKSGEAIRIFTGAPLPEGADTIVMQEKVQVQDQKIIAEDQHMTKGQHVRPVGAEVRAGEIAMRRGDLISPAAAGFLAGIGITEVVVFSKPKVAIILTGKELQKPGSPLLFGQVYEANSYSLSAALKAEGIREIEILEADDDLDVLTGILEAALIHHDVVLLTGGVSVGDYDFVLEASRRCGIQQVFHKVRQKPGKPLFFGTKAEKLIFGLPGNPSSVLSCYYNYVLPGLKKMSGKEDHFIPTQALLTSTCHKPEGLTHFLKGCVSNGKVSPLPAQESFRLSSFAQANCLICLPESSTCCEAGEMVDLILLPDSYGN